MADDPRMTVSAPDPWELATQYFENHAAETADTLGRIRARHEKGTLGDESHLIAHYERNLAYFSVRAKGIRDLAADAARHAQALREKEAQINLFEELEESNRQLLKSLREAQLAYCRKSDELAQVRADYAALKAAVEMECELHGCASCFAEMKAKLKEDSEQHHPTQASI